MGLLGSLLVLCIAGLCIRTTGFDWTAFAIAVVFIVVRNAWALLNDPIALSRLIIAFKHPRR